MPELEDKKTAAGKEPIEITCAGCDTRFRLWVPVDKLPEWERGARVSCVICGAQSFVKKENAAFDVIPLAKAAVAMHAAAPGHAPREPETETRMELEADSGKDSVLIIEDERLSRDMVTASLSEIGFNAIPAKNAAEALKAARKDRISLIVVDLYLKNQADPGADMDGEDVLRKLHDSGLGAPAIITTGKAILDDLMLDPKWFDLNVKGFIQKGNPFWIEDLKLKVKEVLFKG